MKLDHENKHQNRKTLLFSFLWTAVILFIVVYFYLNTQVTMYNQSSSYIDEVSSQITSSIENQCNDRWNVINMLAKYHSALGDFNNADLTNIIDAEKNKLGFSNICFIDKDGNYYDNNQTISLSSNSEISVELFNNNQPVIVNNILSEDKNMISFIAPVESFELEGKIIRAMGLCYESDSIFDVLNINAFKNTANMYVTRKNGTIVFSKTQNQEFSGENLFNKIDKNADFTNGSAEELRANIQNGVTTLMAYKIDGKPNYINHRDINISDWTFIMTVPTDSVNKEITSFSVKSIVFALLVGLSVLIFGLNIYSVATKKILEANKKAREDAENANLSKSQFLSNMSHDIRTPMNAIIGMTAIASSNKNDPEKVQECLKKISLSSQHLLGLINDVLDMSKIESGKMPINLKQMSLKETIENIINITLPTMKKKNQTFNLTLNNIIHEELYCDPLRLSQVFINILSNAVKFTPADRSISIDITELKSDKENYGHYVFIFKDNGIGIKPEFISNIFTAFIRERDSKVDKIEGSGLGMAISKKIVDMFGGTIEVQSEPDKGSVFTVDLHLQLSEKQAKTPDFTGLSFLIADDDKYVCDTLTCVFKDTGLKIECVNNAEKAISKLISKENKKYDALLITRTLPDMDGIQAVIKIRDSIKTDLPIIMISSYDWSDIENDALESGVTAFISKLFFRSTLFQMVDQYVLHNCTSVISRTDKQFNFTGIKILLVEDNEINIEIATVLLKEVGANVITAFNGQEGLKRFALSPIGYFDIILMDIQMPIMNGYQATQAIREMDRTDAKSIPIFALTADAFSEDIAAAKKAGMNSHLAKPLDIPAMMSEIQKHLQK